MSIRVDAAVRRACYEREGSLVIQVVGASDVDAATTALRESIPDLEALDGGPDSAPELGPDDTNAPHSIDVFATAETGPVIFIDPGFTPRELLLKIPEILVAHLEDAGIVDGRLVVPEWKGPLDDVIMRFNGFPERFPTPRVVLVVALPAVYKDQSVPERWLDEAVAWLSLGVAQTEVSAHVSHVAHVSIPLDGARSLLQQGNASSTTIQLALRRADAVLATAAVCPIPYRPRVVLMAGDPSGSGAMAALFHEARAAAQRLAGDAAYAFVNVQDSFAGAMNGLDYGDRASRDNMADPYFAAELADELVLDAYPYQVLSEGHLAKLGKIPEGAEQLDGGRIGLSIGALDEWLSPKRRVRRKLLARGRTLLLPCITTDDAAAAMVRSRMDERPAKSQ